MITKIRKIGNAKGLIISNDTCNELKLTVGSEVEIHVENGAIIIIPPTPTLDQLVKSVKEPLTELKTGSLGNES